MNKLCYLLAASMQALSLTTLAETSSNEARSSDRISAELYSKVESTIASDTDRISAVFKDIHQNPELGFMETRTADIVARELESLGFELQSGIGKTGVLAILRNGKGPTVLYRADMDANAVEEITGLPYASKVRVTLESGEEVPVAHMCGHDAHVSWMLGMARAMVALKETWQGTLVLVGQPAEELIEGAQAMVDDGLYTTHGMPTPDAMIALHTMPVSIGTLISAGGTRNAGTDQLDVTFYGVGGHGSMPHNAKDPVLMAATAVVQYQSIVSRAIDPQQAAVLTVGSIQAGSDNNVIPDSALVKINLRWFSDEVRQQLIGGINAINESIAIANGLPKNKLPTMVIKGSSTPLVNDPQLTAKLNAALSTIVAKDQLISTMPAAMGSEDAHLLLGEHSNVPLSYILVGVVDPGVFKEAGYKPPYYNHNGDYKVDLAAIPYGTRIATIAVLALLANREDIDLKLGSRQALQ